MQVNVAFRHMDASPAVSLYASEKLEHLASKYVSGMDVDAHAVFSTERFLHVANFTIHVNGLTVKSVEKTEDMHASVDLALAKIEQQLKRFKTRIRSHRPDPRRRTFTMQVLAADGAAVEAAESAEPTVAAEPAAEAPAPIRTESYSAPFMSPTDAIVQLELRGGQFFVFTNRDSEHLAIVYRRDDGNFGLIEPEATAG